MQKAFRPSLQKFTATLLTFSLLSPATLFAQDFGTGDRLGYHGGVTHIRLGGGVNKNFPLKFKKSCVNNLAAYNPDSSATEGSGYGTGGGGGYGGDVSFNQGVGVPETAFDIEFVQNTEEMHKLLSISGLLSAQFKFHGIKIPLDINDFRLEMRGATEFQVSDSSLNLVLNIKANYGRQMLSSFDLKPEFQAMLDNGEYQKFEHYCGTHFVAWQRREGFVSAILTVHNLTDEQKRNLRGSVQVGNPPGNQFQDDGLDGSNFDNGRNTNGGNGGNNGQWDDWGDDSPTGDWLTTASLNLPAEKSFASHQVLFKNAPAAGLIPGIGFDKHQEALAQQDPFDPDLPGQNPDPGKPGTGARLTLNNFLKAVQKIGKKATLSFRARGGGGLQHLNTLAENFSGSAESFSNVLRGIGTYLQNFSFNSAPPVEYFLVPYFDYKAQEDDIDHSTLRSTYYAYVEVEGEMGDIAEHVKTLDKIRDQKELEYFENQFNKLSEIRDALWDMAQEILEGSKDYGLNSIPAIPKINWGNFIPAIHTGIYSFQCFTQHPDAKCGAPAPSFWSKYYPWQANLNVTARVHLPHKVSSATLFLTNGRGERKLVSKMMNGSSLSNKDGLAQSFNDKGQGRISINFSKFSAYQNRKNYVAALEDPSIIPTATLELELKNNSKISLDLGPIQFVGKHAKWKTTTSSNRAPYNPYK